MQAVVGDQPLQERIDPMRRHRLVEQSEQMESAAAVGVRQQWPEPELLQAIVPGQGSGPVRHGVGVAAVVGVDVQRAPETAVVWAGAVDAGNMPNVPPAVVADEDAFVEGQLTTERNAGLGDSLVAIGTAEL